MKENRKSPLGELIGISGHLSWKASFTLAVTAYLILRLIARIKPLQPVDMGDFGLFTIKQLCITMAFLGQFVLPVAFLIAGFLSMLRSRKAGQTIDSGPRRRARIDPQSAAPSCPRCGAMMTRRVVNNGADAGEEFWGCSLFPRCIGVRSVNG